MGWHTAAGSRRVGGYLVGAEQRVRGQNASSLGEFLRYVELCTTSPP
jgi:hypothetical protein